MAPPVLIGDYFIIRRLGKGGMGEVFLARHRTTKDEVALKVVREYEVQHPTHLKRFHREITILERLSHPNLVGVFGYGTDQGRHWVAIEYIKGHTLWEWVLQNGPVSEEALVRLGRQIGSALKAIHNEQILHRDIKPSNIMAGTDGRYVLMDFGLAKADDLSVVTEAGKAVGTPMYMSPEMILGQEVTETSDVYQFGLSLYYAATGKLPMSGVKNVGELLEYMVDGQAPGILKQRPEVSGDVENIILNAVAVRPAERYPNMKMLLEDIDRVERGEPVDTIPPGE